MNESLPYKEDLSETDLTNSNIPYIKRKILILGGQGVGKTAFIKRFKNNIYIDDYEPTIQITTKKIITLNNDYIELEIVDLEGQTEYTIFSPNKFSFGYNAYMLVYDVKDKKSFELIKFIYEQINNLSGKTSKILIGAKSVNNIDSGLISDRQITKKEVKSLTDKIHCPFIEVSSQDNSNIEEAFRLLLIEINKTESGVNLRKLKFYKIFKLFIHHQKLAIYAYYAVFSISIMLSILLISTGVKSEIENKSKDNKHYYFGNGFPFIILGLWEILFNACGIFGMICKNIYFLGLNYRGLIYGEIYLIISIVQISCIEIFEGEKDFWCKLIQFLINVVSLIISICLSYIFKTIYEEDLKSYIS